MHEPALARAAMPAPTVCLGMLLRPYSLGHELWLLRENCAALRGAAEGLSTAVLICCQSWDQLATMRGDRLLSLKLWLWRRRARKLDATVELAKFLSYRNAGFDEFPLSQVIRPTGSDARRLPGAPFILRLQQWLMQDLGLGESAAWDYPVGLAKMRWATHWEEQGGLNVQNAHEAEQDAHVAYWEANGGPEAMRALANGKGKS